MAAVRVWPFHIGVVLAALSVLVCSRAGAEEACRICHPDVRIEHDASVHAVECGCTVCHGGDADAVDMEAHAVEHGYIGIPGRADVPALCASCHADPNRMKASGLPTDQLAQYETSMHGRRLAQGDARVAVCTDCHGVHRILGHGEPTNRVSTHNITQTCGACHADQALMASYELPADQVEKFTTSVHGTALLVDDHPSAPTCAGCHGKHGAGAPQVGSIAAVCGHCHARTRQYFNDSPHKEAADRGEMSECVSCHGYHDISLPTRALFDAACVNCHEEGSPAFLAGQRLKTVLQRANESLETAASEMVRMEHVSPAVARYRPRLQQARAYFMEALPVQHALAGERVEDLTRQARFIAEEVRATVHGVEEDVRLRYIGLAFAWGFILFTVAVAYLYKREWRRRRTHDDTGAGTRLV